MNFYEFLSITCLNLLETKPISGLKILDFLIHYYAKKFTEYTSHHIILQLLGCAFSVKFVGLFVILLLGINTIFELWNILGDITKPFIHTAKHFMARVICLIVLPILLYISFFYIHLSVLYKS